VVRPAEEADKAALHLALTQLAEQDPLIDVRQDDARQEFALSLYGEVQKEVIAATLAAELRRRRHVQRDDRRCASSGRWAWAKRWSG
jgi:translation elongation factor EF-G